MSIKQPKISIIVPCRNEEIYIEKCLKSIDSLIYPKDKIEVFVCDGKSTDKTIEIIKEFQKKVNYIKILTNHKQLTPFALNIAIKESSGTYITRIDAHSEVNNDFLNKCLVEFNKDESLGCVGGILDNIFVNNDAKIISYAMSSVFGVGTAHFRTGEKEGYVDTLAFGTYKANIFKEIGLFDEELVRNQDDEFNFRLIKHGYKILLKKNIKAKYYVRSSFKKLFKQYFQYGYWKVYVNKKHKTVTSIRQLIPFFFVLYLISGSLLSVLSTEVFFVFIGIFIVYLLLSFTFALKKTKFISEVLKVMISFFILHFSYGLGYLRGVVRFILLNKKPEKSQTQLSR